MNEIPQIRHLTQKGSNVPYAEVWFRGKRVAAGSIVHCVNFAFNLQNPQDPQVQKEAA